MCAVSCQNCTENAHPCVHFSDLLVYLMNLPFVYVYIPQYSSPISSTECCTLQIWYIFWINLFYIGLIFIYINPHNCIHFFRYTQLSTKCLMFSSVFFIISQTLGFLSTFIDTHT